MKPLILLRARVLVSDLWIKMTYSVRRKELKWFLCVAWRRVPHLSTMPHKCRNAWKKDSEVEPVQENHLPFSRTAAGLWVQSFGNLWSKIYAEKLSFCRKCLFSRSDFLGQTSLCLQYLQYLVYRVFQTVGWRVRRDCLLSMTRSHSPRLL